MRSMFWEECNEPSFYKHICQPQNVWQLNGKNVIYPKVAQIVMDYIVKDENNFDKLKKKLVENQKNISISVLEHLPLSVQFCEKRRKDLGNYFQLKIKEWKDKKKYSQKSTDSYLLPKAEKLLAPLPKSAIEKKLVTGEDHENEKNIADEQKQKETEEKKTKKEREKTRECGKK